MRLKNDSHSGEVCRAIDAREDSNFEGEHVDSSHLSSENAASRIGARNSCKSYLSEDIEIPPKLPSHGTSMEDQLSSRPSSVSDQWQDQKGVGHDNGSLSTRISSNETEALCSGRDKYENSASCSPEEVNISAQGVEVVDSLTIHESVGLSCDYNDRHIDSMKHGQFTEDTIQQLSSSSSIKCCDKGERVTKPNKATESDEMHEPTLQTSPEDDTDESEVEEEDVKVCDICGDAGREDLLAVCSRCSDGAEHTYCMREMLDKVPEGEWLCEECKLNEELEARKQEHSKMGGSIERSKSLGRTSSINSDLSFKLDNKDPCCGRSKLKNVSINKHGPSKRRGEGIEGGPTAKKQAVESSLSSPMTSSPSRMAVLSKDSSSKNLDKAKGKPTIQISTSTELTGDSLESGRSPTTSSLCALKGNFVKSNSFGSSNSKPNIKLSDEVPQKPNQGVDAKDGHGKLIGKSMSFKGVGRSSGSEPKVKMISPKCTPVQELKSQKPGRDRNPFERKNTIKSDHPFLGHMAANTSKRPSRGDNVSTVSITHSRDYKNAQSDGKLTTLSKHAGHSVQKSSDGTASLGEVKRLSSSSISGFASVNGTGSCAEAKPSQVNHKDGTTPSSSRAADRSLVGSNGAKVDVLDNQGEKAPESYFGRSRQGVNAGVVFGNRRLPSSDASVSKTKEGLHEENKLKAAIEAAMQKKQDIFKKNRISEKTNEVSVSNTQGIYAGDAVSNQARDAVSEEAMPEGEAALGSHNSNSCKRTSVSSANQLKVYPADYVISPIGESGLTMSAFPEQESVWQGGFEIHRSGKFLDMCGGFQAHLSSFACSKVLEVVKKFPQKIVLNEVPRQCAWPVQFKETGAREDNIALYFFAKDLDSYMRSYKILLEYMMKHDLAFKGNINEVELLVFPSNHLPDKSQCWNTLFFMWGVFRGRRRYCADSRSTSPEQPEISTSNMIPLDKEVTSATNPSENPCLHRPVREDLSVLCSGHTVVSGRETSVSAQSYLQQSGSLSNGNCYNQGCSVGRTGLSAQTSTENPEMRRGNQTPLLGAEASPELRTAALKDQCPEDTNISIEHQHQHSTLVIDRGYHLHEAEKTPSDVMPDKQDISSHSSKMPPPVDKQESRSVVSSEEQEVLDTASNKIINQVESENSLKQENKSLDKIKNDGEMNVLKEEEDMKSTVRSGGGKLKLEGGGLKQEVCVDINVSADSNMEDHLHSMHLSPKRHLHVDSTESVSQVTCMITAGGKRAWMDRKDTSEASTNKKIKGGDDLLYRLPNSFGQMHHATSSHREEEEDTCNEGGATDEKLTSGERFFFLVGGSQSTHTHTQSGGEDLDLDLLPWKASAASQNHNEVHGSPNLELALGVEKKQSRKGVLPFFAEMVDRNDHPDRPPDIGIAAAAAATSKDEDATPASLSLSLAFPSSPPPNVEHDLNTSLLLFRGSSTK